MKITFKRGLIFHNNDALDIDTVNKIVQANGLTDIEKFIEIYQKLELNLDKNYKIIEKK